MPVAYNSLLLTPDGPTYIFNLRRGQKIWVYEHNRFVARPLDFKVAERQPALEIKVRQQRFSMFQGKATPTGSFSRTVLMLQHEVMTLQGYLDIVLAEGKSLPRIPELALSPPPPYDNRFAFGPDAMKRLQTNEQRKPVPSGPSVELDSVGPMDDVTVFGGKTAIESVWATVKNIPAVNILTANCVTNGLIIKGD